MSSLFGARFTSGPPGAERPFTFDEAMRRLAYLMGVGGIVVVAYGLSVGSSYTATISIGLMMAFASAVAAGLIGFIFGVPFSRETGGAAPKAGATTDGPDAEANASSYRPNTSLEQISDWLTKMLVGVGLVEIKELPASLHRLVHYIAPSVGQGQQAEVFVLTVLVSFSVCGFLFGFLWARLYLRRWLTDADRDLIDKLSRFDADAKAYSLVSRQLERREDEPPVPEGELQTAIHAASSAAKLRIFEQAHAASEDSDAVDYQSIKNPGVISILKALIVEDSQARYHRNHAELSYALDRQRPANLPAAIEAITEVINRRDRMHKKGWRYYEFRRARDRIRQDQKYSQGQPSNSETASLIANDIRAAAAGESGKFDRWIKDHLDVADWMRLNNVNIERR